MGLGSNNSFRKGWGTSASFWQVKIGKGVPLLLKIPFHFIFITNRDSWLEPLNTQLYIITALGTCGRRKKCFRGITEIVVSIFQVLDNGLLVFFKHSSSAGNNLAGTLCFYAKRKTTLPVNRAGNTAQPCSLPSMALLQGPILEQVYPLGIKMWGHFSQIFSQILFFFSFYSWWDWLCMRSSVKAFSCFFKSKSIKIFN